jgi:hypothetical protein
MKQSSRYFFQCYRNLAADASQNLKKSNSLLRSFMPFARVKGNKWTGYARQTGWYRDNSSLAFGQGHFIVYIANYVWRLKNAKQREILPAGNRKQVASPVAKRRRFRHA